MRAGLLAVLLLVGNAEPSIAIPDYIPRPIPPDSRGMELSAMELADQLTLGVNISNSLEAPDGETSWGNPLISREYVELIKASGFNLVRLPVAWHSHADPETAQIDPAWLDRVEEVVELCLEQNLFVIMNIHWDGGWLERNVTPDKSDEVAARQRAYWQQIATRFRDVDQRLMFASANEPAVENAEDMNILYRYHQAFIDAVRSTGGRNAWRNLVVQGPTTDIEKTNQFWRDMPADTVLGRLMMEVHYYTPYQFTIMETDEEWGKVFYYWGERFHSPDDTERNATWGEEDEMDRLFGLMNEQFIQNDVPVILGEFGARRRDGLKGEALERHLLSRAHYMRTVTATALKHGLVPVAWDPDGKRGLFDRRAAKIFDTQTHQALLAGVADARD
jgi:endoglucanase